MRNQQIAVTCIKCGTEVRRSPSVIAKNKGGKFYCSLACAGRKSGRPRTKPHRVCPQCSDEFYPTNSGSRFCSKKCYDAFQRRNRIERTCAHCKRTFGVKLSEERKATGSSTGKGVRFCSKRCESLGKFKRGLDRWHNDKPLRVNRQGYVYAWQPDHPDAHSNGWILEHRLVAAQKLGRSLRADEQVHHVNGDKQDNRPENLSVLDPSAHTYITLAESSMRRSATQGRIRELEAELERYREKFGSVD